VITRREALVFVHRGDEALVLFRVPDDAYWHVVAGGIEEGETSRAAARRELREETGLDAEVHALRRRYVWAGADGGEVEGECYAVEAPAGWEPLLNEEHSEYRWCSFQEAAALVRWPEVGECLLLLGTRIRRRPVFRFTVKRPRTPAVFFLRFEAEGTAEEVGEVLRGDGYAVSVEPEPAHWLVTARGDVRVDSFDVAEEALSALAEAKGGRYAGCRREPDR
jgi:8-oxo-dGTP pyrophosphatase MutT (NUDIX family)